MQKILIIDDDEMVRDSVKRMLEADHHTVDIASSVEQGCSYVDAFSYDLLVVDWELPDGSGVEFCKKLRARGLHTPILILTGRSSIDHKEEGFESGADDYLTKPFHRRELAVRVRALLRRPAIITGKRLVVSDLQMDLESKSVTRAGTEIDLQPHELAVLEYFMRTPGTVHSTEQLLRHCWHSDSEVTSEAVYTCIRRLRKKLCPAGEKSLFVTVHGRGYKLDSE